MHAKKLRLKRDVMSELTAADMAGVVGAGTDQCLTIQPAPCLSIRVCEITNQLICLAPSVLPDTCLC